MGTATVNGDLWGTRARDWSELQEGQHRDAYVSVLDRLAVGHGISLLDVGCGSGMAAQMAATRGAAASGIDASDALLAIARERTPGGDFRVGEIEDLPFADGSFDVVTGFNSFQYAANVGAALQEARRVVRATGAVAMMTWGPPDGMPAASIVAALRPLMPPPPPGAPGPFALSGEVTLRDLVAANGLDVEFVGDVQTAFAYPDLETGIRALNSSGVAERACRHAGVEAVEAAHRTALMPFVEVVGGRVRVPAVFRYVIARKS
jgi:SAM-dependent methyltransferase